MPFGTHGPTGAPSPPAPPNSRPTLGHPPIEPRRPGRVWAPVILLSATWAAFLIHYRYPIFPYLIIAVLLACCWRLRAGAVSLLVALGVLAWVMAIEAPQPWHGRLNDLLALTLVGSVFVGGRGLLDSVERQRRREQQLVAELSEAVAQLRARERELLTAHEQLLRAERLAALGQFSATMAHELRNPLNVVKLSIHAVTSRVPAQDEKLQRNLAHMNRSVDRASRIIDDLLAFSRLPAPQQCPVAVNEIVREAIAALAVPPPVRIEWSLAPDLPPAAADARQLEQAVGNLGLNALQAMPEGGCLRVGTRREGERVAITVQDSGAGVPEALRERVFEPFFSTKVTGTGLGLPLVREIALAHGGDVTLHSPAEGGACFVLALPLAEPSSMVLSTMGHEGARTGANGVGSAGA